MLIRDIQERRVTTSVENMINLSLWQLMSGIL